MPDSLKDSLSTELDFWLLMVHRVFSITHQFLAKLLRIELLPGY
jgi:hypothetical protein